MKLKVVASTLAFALILVLCANHAFTNRNGAPAGRSGGAGESSCATSSCHSGTANSGPGLVNLVSDAPNNVYTPGNTYTITATVDQSGISRFGFQVLSGYSGTANASVGTTAIIAAAETKLLNFGQRTYVTQVTGGSSGTNTRSWSFSWTAPAQGAGDIDFFLAGNAANNNGNRTGDQIYTTSLTLVEAAVGLEDAFRATSMEVYPSLAYDKVNLLMEDVGLEPLQLQILNQQGQVVRDLQLVPAGTELRREINLQGFAAGMYYLRVIGEEFSGMKKFVKY